MITRGFAGRPRAVTPGLPRASAASRRRAERGAVRFRRRPLRAAPAPPPVAGPARSTALRAVPRERGPRGAIPRKPRSPRPQTPGQACLKIRRYALLKILKIGATCRYLEITTANWSYPALPGGATLKKQRFLPKPATSSQWGEALAASIWFPCPQRSPVIPAPSRMADRRCCCSSTVGTY